MKEGSPISPTPTTESEATPKSSMVVSQEVALRRAAKLKLQVQKIVAAKNITWEFENKEFTV